MYSDDDLAAHVEDERRMTWTRALRLIETIIERTEDGGGLAVTDDECNIDEVIEGSEIEEALQAAREALAIQVDAERKRKESEARGE